MFHLGNNNNSPSPGFEPGSAACEADGVPMHYLAQSNVSLQPNENNNKRLPKSIKRYTQFDA